MEKTSFTPGEWTKQPIADYWDAEGYELQVINAGGQPVAFVPIRKGEYKITSYANAHLVKASPDLYAALEALTTELKEGGRSPDLATIHAFIMPKADAALRAARGEE